LTSRQLESAFQEVGEMSDLIYGAILSTETANNTENRDPEDDDVMAMSLTTMRESKGGEGADEDEDDSRAAHGRIDLDVPLLVTTLIKDDGAPAERDDEEDELLFAMATIKTAATGDPSDPEDDGLLAILHGDKKPLLYRFAEPGPSLDPKVRYDEEAQVHVLIDGRIAADAVKERVRTSR
jgi:hypothetical protein